MNIFGGEIASRTGTWGCCVCYIGQSSICTTYHAFNLLHNE